MGINFYIVIQYASSPRDATKSDTRPLNCKSKTPALKYFFINILITSFESAPTKQFLTPLNVTRACSVKFTAAFHACPITPTITVGRVPIDPFIMYTLQMI